MKGWIALDIDGTITLDKYSVPKEVRDFLKELQAQGWNIVLATGRPFAFASIALSEFDFPYTFVAQNGSLALEMPTQKFLFKNYLTPQTIQVVDDAYEGIDSDFVIYAGYEKGDFCYWRPHRLSSEDLRYLEDVQKRQKEKWQAVDNFDQLDPFPLIKCFGHTTRMDRVAGRLRSTGLFQVAKIRDPFEEGITLLLVTEKCASKGAALAELFKRKGRGPLVIAAGDDENDLSLLQQADIKIAMAHAPAMLTEVATFIAPPTKDHGIIRAIQCALKN